MQPITLLPPSPTSQISVASRRKGRPSAGAECGCAAPADDQGAQAAALAALATLAAACSASQTVVAQNPLGRYSDSGSCTYDCGFMEQDWSWWADYRFVNTNLQNCVAGMNFSGPYGVACQPMQAWVGSSLPTINTSVNGDLQDIRQIDAAIIAAGGDETPAQRAQLASDFTDLGNQLARNLGLANGALQQLAGFVSWEQGQGGAVDALVASSKTYIQTSATNNENNLIGQIACGAGDVQNSFNNMFTDIASKFTTMTTSFNTVDQDFEAAIQAAQAVAGVFLVLQQDSALVSQRLDLAQGLSPTDPLRLMDLNIATNVWTELVNTATAQLQAGV
jgi:hypothetical protein